MSSLVIGTRGSALAIWQAELVRAAIVARYRNVQVSLKVIQTKGDKVRQAPLYEILGKGFFTKEIEDNLLAGSIDLAVHSLKDLPTRLAPGLAVAAVPAREDPADVLVAKSGLTLESLPHGARVLSGSLRRRSQLLHRRPDLNVVPRLDGSRLVQRTLSAGVHEADAAEELGRRLADELRRDGYQDILDEMAEASRPTQETGG